LLWFVLGRRTPFCVGLWEEWCLNWVDAVSVRRSCSLAQVGGFKGKVRKARVSFWYRAELPAEQRAAVARVCRVPVLINRLRFDVQ